MKKRQIITFVSIILCFLTFSGFFINKTKKYIQNGDKALQYNKFEDAYENYRKAGEEGREKLKAAYLREIRQCRDQEKYLYSAQKRTVDNVLDDIEKNEDEKLYAEILLSLIADMQKQETSNKKIYDIMDRVPENYQSEIAELRKEMELEDLEKNIKTAISIEDWKYLQRLCRDNPDHEEVKKYQKIFDHLEEKPTIEAAQYLREILHYEKAKMFWKYAIKGYEPKTMEETIYFHMANEAFYYDYRPGTEDKISITEIFNPGSMCVFFGIDPTEEAQTITTAMKEELKKLCGKEADGKILIIHDRADYGTDDREMDIVWHLMDKLPDSYQPTGLKQVKYLFYLKSDYTKGGTYNGGTQQIRETTKMSLYDTETGKVIYSKTVSGKTSNVMYYTNYKPVYYSAESPDMVSAFAEAMKKINQLK